MREFEAFLTEVMTSTDCQRLLDSLTQLLLVAKPDGTIMFWNNAGSEIFGYRDQEVAGKKIGFLFPDLSPDAVTEYWDQLTHESQVSIVLSANHKEGKTLLIDLELHLFTTDKGSEFLVVSGCDVTEEIKTQKKFAREEQSLKAIMDTAVEGIITIDTRGNIENFNSAAENIFGYSAEEVIGENVNILMPNPYHEEHDQYMKNYLETGERKIIGIGREVRGKRKNGEVFPMELSVSEVKVNGDDIFTGIVRDISDRRRLENEILQITEKERQRIGRELHDGLGQMLTGIGLIAKNLADKLKSNELPGAEEVREIADMIREADEQARSLSHGLVNLELEEGANVALSQLCDRAARLFNIDCHKEIDPDLEITNKVALLHLYRIVQEAVSNAVKHGDASKIEVRLQQQDDFLELQVIDNGMGFSDPPKKQKESGMGVNTMRYRANMLGGYLGFRETREGYTMLNCRIPLHEFNNIKPT